MFSPAAATDVIGKTIIVGITYTRHTGDLIRLEQYTGRIVRCNANEGLVIQTPSGVEEKLPPDLRPLFGARRGEHRFRVTGEIVADPDLQTSWTSTAPPPGQAKRDF